MQEKKRFVLVSVCPFFIYYRLTVKFRSCEYIYNSLIYKILKNLNDCQQSLTPSVKSELI